MKFKNLRWIAIALILITGYLHLITAGDEYAETRYMGVLFLLNFLGALISAVGIYRRKLWWGWILGIVITLGSIVGYVQSRTFGMPGMDVEEWYDPIGIPAMIVEGLFLAVTLLAKPWSASVIQEADSTPITNANRQSVLVASMTLVVITVGFFSYQAGARESHNKHPLPETVISNERLEEEYGIRVTLVAVTAAGGLVDVRYKVVDPEKAAKLVDEEEGGIMPMVFVGNGEVMLMADSHMRDQRLVADRTYFTLIPNAQNAVQRGSVITVVFGDVALEPMLAQ
ncbi:MAG: hypothetical protein HUU11_17695 [Anaerolineales bacterium]|nr:hypothetical protein [Anaerolineales bacterium]